MYSENDLKEINALVKKRWLITLIPSGIVLAAAIAIFDLMLGNTKTDRRK